MMHTTAKPSRFRHHPLIITTVLTGSKEQLNVRLFSIDGPEGGQAFGNMDRIKFEKIERIPGELAEAGWKQCRWPRCSLPSAPLPLSDNGVADFGGNPLAYRHCSENDDKDQTDLRPGQGVETVGQFKADAAGADQAKDG